MKIAENIEKERKAKIRKNISQIKFRFWYDLSNTFSCLNPL